MMMRTASRDTMATSAANQEPIIRFESWGLGVLEGLGRGLGFTVRVSSFQSS